MPCSLGQLEGNPLPAAVTGLINTNRMQNYCIACPFATGIAGFDAAHRLEYACTLWLSRHRHAIGDPETERFLQERLLPVTSLYSNKRHSIAPLNSTILRVTDRRINFGMRKSEVNR